MDLQVGGASAFNVSKAGSLKLGINSSGTNVAGTNVVIAGSQGTGTGAGGSIIFQTAPAGLTGNTPNGFQNSLLIDHEGQATFTVKNTGGTPTLQIAKSGSASIQVTTTATFGIGSSASSLTLNANAGSSPIYAAGSYLNIGTSANNDVQLYRDATNTLALRNGANAQAFRVYNTYTDATTFERANSYWDSNVLKIGTEKGSVGGTARALELQTDATSRWSIGATTGHLLASADNTYDIGASGGSRPRNVYVAGDVYCSTRLRGSEVLIGSIVAPDVSLYSTGSGVLRVSNSTGSDFGRMMFGGTTSSFPALKRVSANLQVIAADGTSSAGLIVGNQALATTATDGFLYVPTCAGTPTGTPTTQTGTVPIVVDTTNNKLYFYSNAAWRDAGP
jgi:hypothetical protein